MILQDCQVFKATLITKGRKTSKPHAVELRAVYYNKTVFFSRRKPDSDWLRNAIATQEVTIEYGNERHTGKASLVMDEDLARKISHLKYSDKRSEVSRVVIQVKLCE